MLSTESKIEMCLYTCSYGDMYKQYKRKHSSYLSSPTLVMVATLSKSVSSCEYKNRKVEL